MIKKLAEGFTVDGKAFNAPVVVTGAGGCIGSWVVAMLHESGVKTISMDLNKSESRLRLLMKDDELITINWELGDISDEKYVFETIEKHKPQAIIHLAAMQIPFCAVDPIKGAQTNVVGFVNIMEAARKNDIKRIAYASSIAAYGLMDSKKYQPTFYGAYKVCNEHYCEALFKNNGVPSIGLRPSIVYGVGRDQGMTAKPTEAILAAAAKKKFTIPFSGPISVLYAGEVAAAFIKAVSKDISDAMVFDINGSLTSVEDWCGLVRKINPDSSIAIEGNSLPFPVGMSDDPLREQVGDYGIIDPEEGIKLTYMAFSQLLSEGKLKM